MIEQIIYYRQNGTRKTLFSLLSIYETLLIRSRCQYSVLLIRCYSSYNRGNEAFSSYSLIFLFMRFSLEHLRAISIHIDELQSIVDSYKETMEAYDEIDQIDALLTKALEILSY